jgi:predicted nucleic acid-binding protein
MSALTTPRTLFVDTQALIYAFEKSDRAWLNFIESRLSSGYRLVLSQDTLEEFGQSSTLEAAVELTRSVTSLTPLWIRTFADLETDEVCSFAIAHLTRQPPEPIVVFVESFPEISKLADKYHLDPVEYVRLSFDTRIRREASNLALVHAKVLDELSRAQADGQMTKEVKARAFSAGLRARLSRGTPLIGPISGADLEVSVKHCVKHQRRLMRECHAFATELHLADYRTKSPKRIARASDSKDLMMASAAFPYVSAFATNDGYLHGGLSYVKVRLPHNSTELIRSP